MAKSYQPTKEAYTEPTGVIRNTSYHVNIVSIANFMKKVPSVYTHYSMTTIYLFLSAQVAEGTIFRKSPVSRRYKYV